MGGSCGTPAQACWENVHRVTNHDVCYGYYESPIGLIEVGGTEGAITSLYFCGQRRPEGGSNLVVHEALRQIDAYFAGVRRAFDVPIDLHGTSFQLLVWQQLLTIPFGHTVSYQGIANAIGKPKAVRAVGAANGQNLLSIIVPCHRVIGSRGALVGYGGGLWRKEWLLRHEGTLLL
jgi:methylated-DNA-[protein]-cysteine S-methyltransferase